MTEIERVAEAIQAKCKERGYKGCPEPLVHQVAGAAIEALDAFRAEEKRKNCKHWNAYGTGSTGDGLMTLDWHCRDCGASFSTRS